MDLSRVVMPPTLSDELAGYERVEVVVDAFGLGMVSASTKALARLIDLLRNQSRIIVSSC